MAESYVFFDLMAAMELLLNRRGSQNMTPMHARGILSVSYMQLTKSTHCSKRLMVVNKECLWLAGGEEVLLPDLQRQVN